MHFQSSLFKQFKICFQHFLVFHYIKKRKKLSTYILYHFTLFPDLCKWFNPLSANFTKWSNTLKQFVGNLPTNCLSVFDRFVRLALKGLRCMTTVNMETIVSFCALLYLPMGKLAVKMIKTGNSYKTVFVSLSVTTVL